MTDLHAITQQIIDDLQPPCKLTEALSTLAPTMQKAQSLLTPPKENPRLTIWNAYQALVEKEGISEACKYLEYLLTGEEQGDSEELEANNDEHRLSYNQMGLTR